MSTILTSVVAHGLKETLEEIVDDPTDGIEANAVFTQWCYIRTMEDNYEDDLEMAGPGYASEKPESQESAVGTIREGANYRYLARTFALKLIVSEEAIEDVKYDKIIDAAMRLKRSLWKTCDVDATNMLVRAANTSYVYGDGQPLASTVHPLPNGGTFSNTLATPLAPSRQAIIVATSMIRKYPGHDGTTEGFEPKAVLSPTEQWAEWDGILLSEKAPESGQFNLINVANRLKLKSIPIKYWSNTTTNWCLTTDADNGFNFRWKRRPRNRSWVDNDHQVMKYSIDARWSRGTSEPRAICFSNA